MEPPRFFSGSIDSRLPASTAPARCTRATSDFITLRLQRAPRARRTIVFFHGLLGDSGQWDLALAHTDLAADSDLVWIDFHFEQARAEPLTFDRLTHGSMELIAAAGIDPRLPVILAGSSFGGHIVLHLSARSGQRADGLFLVTVGGIAEIEQNRRRFPAFTGLESIAQASLERMFVNSAAHAEPQIKAYIESYRARAHPHLRDLARNLLSLARTIPPAFLRADELGRIAAPALLVWGRQDIVTPPETALLLAERLGQARVAWLDGGHAVHLEQAGACGRLLGEFCANHHSSLTPERLCR